VSRTDEGQSHDHKSLRAVTGPTADFAAIAQDCVCFANGGGGRLLIGIEDSLAAPPPAQRVPPGLLDRLRKRIGELSVNVQVFPELVSHENGGEYVVLTIPRAVGVASTSDGRFYLRVGDSCKPVVGDEILRLADERPSTPWELMVSLGVPEAHADATRVAGWAAAVRGSGRVKASVKEKSDSELLAHYHLALGKHLTNLGILIVGTATDRARLSTAPIVQAVRYDDRGEKIGKYAWDDHTRTPVELLDAVWRDVPDFREAYELPEGMFRTSLPAFDEIVVREVLVNALVHRPYTHRGDIFLNLHPDRLEVVNPGRLPLGVTPHNILHASRRRNDALARLFHDLGLMEREGSGFDLLYERLLATGRAAPTVREGEDSVWVTVPRRVLHPGVVRLLAEADQRYRLTQRERITLGLLAQNEGLSAADLVEGLALSDARELRGWVARLCELGLVEQSGRTRGTRYTVPPALLRASGLDRKTTLARLPPHRLRALVVEDLRRYPGSSRGDIHRRIGPEIHERTLGRALAELVLEGLVLATGETRWRRYQLPPAEGHPL
jgi:ATP-dependent DNA helicase RecG